MYKWFLNVLINFVVSSIDGNLCMKSGFSPRFESGHMDNILYLRNRKHFPCFYRVIGTRVGRFGRTRNAVGTRAAGECFDSFFEFSQTFTSVSITR